jgi:glycerol-3-phosphate acyltransferase PlsY
LSAALAWVLVLETESATAMNATLAMLLLPAAAYLAGSVNFSILLFRLMGKGDPRVQFSGNPGVSNVVRQAGLPLGVLVLVLDTGRSAAVAALCSWAAPPAFLPWGALALLAGNRWPLFHGFSGGKGVANFLGFTLFVSPLAAVLGGMSWGLVFYAARKPFLGSFAMTAVLAAGIALAAGPSPPVLAGVLLSVLFIILNHRKNIRETIAGARMRR